MKPQSKNQRSRNRGGAIVVAIIAVAMIASLLMTGAAEKLNERTAVTSFSIYASLRIINSALSTAQETEVKAGVVVLGGSAKPLKILEPLDDFVEQISAIVLWIAVFSGVLSVGLWPLVAIGLALLLLSLICRFSGLSKTRFASMERAVLFPGLILGLIIPATFVMAPLVAEFATKGKWEEAISTLSAFADKSEEFVEKHEQDVVSENEVNEESGLLSSVRNFGASVSNSVDSGLKATGDVFSTGWDYLGNADDLIAALFVIGSILIFKLLVLPIISLLLFGYIIRRAFLV